MPELPDVEIFKRYMDSTSLHQSIQDIDAGDSEDMLAEISRRDLKNRLKNRSLLKTSRHGKHLFAKLDNDQWLMFHFGMTGFFKYYKRSSQKPEHVRLRIDFTNGYSLAFDSRRRLGEISLIDEPKQFVQDRNLGPDALKDLTKQQIEDYLMNGREMIKSFLMNQEKIAGLGNIYSDEILFQVRLHPRTKPPDIGSSGVIVKELYTNIRKVLKTAINAGAVPEKFPDHFLIPNREKGRQCPRCGESVESIKCAGRTSYYCPGCLNAHGELLS